MRIVTYNQAGEIISDVGTPETAQEVESEKKEEIEIDLDALSENDFKRKVLEGFGYKVKK